MNDWADQATIRERQKAACAVLARLLDLDLPAPNWELSSIYSTSRQHGELKGLLSDAYHGTDADRQASLDAWAAHFGVTPEPNSSGKFVYVRATVDGVNVTVWAGMDGPRKRQTRKQAAVTA